MATQCYVITLLYCNLTALMEYLAVLLEYLNLLFIKPVRARIYTHMAF